MVRGFTLLELLIVISLMFIVGTFSFIVGASFLRVQALDEVSGDLTSVLRRAHSQAVFQKNDSSHGIKILSNSYVLFEGDSYTARTVSEDETFFVSSATFFAGLDEVVFLKLTGLPNATGTITVLVHEEQKDIYINNQGRIER